MDHHTSSLEPFPPDPSSLPALPIPGAVTTFYAYDGGAARNALLAALALQLAGSDGAQPVLVIDWDLDAPALHRHFALPALQADMPDGDGQPPGLLELLDTCAGILRGTGGAADADGDGDAGADSDARADRALDAAGWMAHIARADGRRPLYLMRAGRFDDGYAGRAGRLDLEALFATCPALFRRLAARLASRFGQVLVASRTGRSAAVSVCSTLLPDRLVALFTPAPGSLEGVEGVVRRAIAYRCSHENEQRPLMVYPVACSADGARSDPHGRWRRGDARAGQPGYQARCEDLLRASYGWPRVELDSWFDEAQLALADALSTAGTGGDRRALARLAAVLAEWVAPGRFPWQSLCEVRLRRAIAQARMPAAGAGMAAQCAAPGSTPGAVFAGAPAGGDVSATSSSMPLALYAASPQAAADLLADALARLGDLCRREHRRDEARACIEESLALRVAGLGDDHAATRAARAALAALLLENGALPEARRQCEALVQACVRATGTDAPDTLAARSQLARTLAGLGESERALALHEQAVASCERALGDEHPVTLACLEDLAQSLVLQHEFDRARVLCERALAARRRSQGGEHADTLRCARRLAQLLGAAGELGNARRLLESVLRAHERHDGPDAAGAVAAREALAEILAAQGDLAAVHHIKEALARSRERHPGRREGSSMAAHAVREPEPLQRKY